MRWTLTAKRGVTAGGVSFGHDSQIELVVHRHDFKIPFRTLHDAAAIEFLKKVVLTDE